MKAYMCANMKAKHTSIQKSCFYRPDVHFMWERLSSVYIVNFEQINADLLEGTPFCYTQKFLYWWFLTVFGLCDHFIYRSEDLRKRRISFAWAFSAGDYLSGGNWTRTQNHLVRKRTLNYLAKLAKLVQNQQWNTRTIWNLLKVENKDTRT